MFKIKYENIIKIIQFLILFIILIVWEVLSKFNIINTFIFSSPSNIFKTLVDLLFKNELIKHVLKTSNEILIGFFLTSLISFLISILFWYKKILFDIFEPFLLVLNAIPKVALGPLIIIWIGANESAIIFMALTITIFSSTLNMYNFFKNTDNSLIFLLKSFYAKKYQILYKVVIPSNYDNLINLCKINLSMTFIGVIMGELLISKYGIGYLIMYGSQIFNINLIITCVIVLSILSYLFNIIIKFIILNLFKKKAK